MKTCSKCKSEKPLDQFHAGKGADGKHAWCKSCVSKNRAQAYRDDPDSRIRHQLWTRYRLRPEDVQRMLLEQGGVCKLCPRCFGPDLKWHIDHDHKTGVVRGLLCPTCNGRVGWLERDPQLVLDYLGLGVVSAIFSV